MNADSGMQLNQGRGNSHVCSTGQQQPAVQASFEHGVVAALEAAQQRNGIPSSAQLLAIGGLSVNDAVMAHQARKRRRKEGVRDASSLGTGDHDARSSEATTRQQEGSHATHLRLAAAQEEPSAESIVALGSSAANGTGAASGAKAGGVAGDGQPTALSALHSTSGMEESSGGSSTRHTHESIDAHDRRVDARAEGAA